MVITKNKEKGVTLIALVLSIILILILAGISISMLTGQNGILNRTVEAVKKTNEQAEVEKIKMAVANYNIEKSMNSSLTFKGFCENNGFEDIKIIDENPSEEIQFIAEIDGKLFIMKSDGSYVRTKSKNLVKNGFCENGNENFEDFELKNKSFFLTTSEYIQIISTDFIGVNTNKKYYESIIMKSNNENAIYYAGITEYDVDKHLIGASTYLYTENTLTYLEKDLKNGDTEIYLNDLHNFNMKNIRRGTNDGLIFWNYKDSTGYEYPELTYSRNVFFYLFNDENDFDLKENKITLEKPWSFGNIEKGTKLSQSFSASTYNYGIMNGKNITSKYKYYENNIEGVKKGESEVTTKFRPATKYIKILILINYNNLPDITTNIKDIIFAEME